LWFDLTGNFEWFEFTSEDIESRPR
jgi:hypothetical protein